MCKRKDEEEEDEAEEKKSKHSGSDGASSEHGSDEISEAAPRLKFISYMPTEGTCGRSQGPSSSSSSSSHSASAKSTTAALDGR